MPRLFRVAQTATHLITWCAMVMLTTMVIMITLATETPLLATLSTGTGRSQIDPAIVFYTPWLCVALAIVIAMGIVCGGLRRVA